jgi:hypothetical protein
VPSDVNEAGLALRKIGSKSAVFPIPLAALIQAGRRSRRVALHHSLQTHSAPVPINVRYAFDSDHSTAQFVCPLSANSGHLRFLRRSVLRRLVARVYFSATGRESSDANVPIFAAFLLLRISILL